MILKNFFLRYSFLANSVTFASLFGLGDFIEQQRERYNSEHNKECHSQMKPYNFRRTLDMVIVGGLLSPVVHYWYIALDKVIVGNIHSMVVKKVLADEIIMSPIFGIAFLAGKLSRLPIS
jgi:protein Mpv17